MPDASRTRSKGDGADGDMRARDDLHGNLVDRYDPVLLSNSAIGLATRVGRSWNPENQSVNYLHGTRIHTKVFTEPADRKHWKR